MAAVSVIAGGGQSQQCTLSSEAPEPEPAGLLAGQPALRRQPSTQLTSPSTISAAADDAMNAMLANLKLPVEEKVEVTYTTRSGDVVKTRKPLRPLGHTFVLSEAPDHPVLAVAVVGYTNKIRSLMNVYNNVEDDADRSAAAKQDIAELQLEDVRVVASSRYEDVLGDRFVRVVILAGPQEAREARAKSALSAGKHVLCERPIAFTLHSAKEVFDLARSKQAIFMPMLPGRPGKAFSAVVMSLFSSSEMIECQRKLPDDFKAPKQEAQDDKALLMLFADIAMQDIFAVNFSICMRPLSVTARRIASQEHSVEVSVTYPNRLVYTVRGGFGQDKIDTQLFKLTGEALNTMRRVDHMHDDRQTTHAANTTFASDEEGTGGMNMLRFLQDYEVARADALEQMYAMASGAKALASRVRPQLMENNLCDCLRVAAAAHQSLKSNSATVDIMYQS